MPLFCLSLAKLFPLFATLPFPEFARDSGDNENPGWSQASPKPGSHTIDRALFASLQQQERCRHAKGRVRTSPNPSEAATFICKNSSRTGQMVPTDETSGGRTLSRLLRRDRGRRAKTTIPVEQIRCSAVPRMECYRVSQGFVAYPDEERI